MDFFANLRRQSDGRLEFFPSASADQIERLESLFPAFSLSDYIALLSKSNGIGEVFAEGSQRFVHNMLLFAVEDALHWSKSAFQNSYLAVGAPGVDGMFFVLSPGGPQVFVHKPIDNEFVQVASSVRELPLKWLAGELCL
jgi:hypothetical protein